MYKKNNLSEMYDLSLMILMWGILGFFFFLVLAEHKPACLLQTNTQREVPGVQRRLCMKVQRQYYWKYLNCGQGTVPSMTI